MQRNRYLTTALAMAAALASTTASAARASLRAVAVVDTPRPAPPKARRPKGPPTPKKRGITNRRKAALRAKQRRKAQ